jgi:hypothetical protein
VKKRKGAPRFGPPDSGRTGDVAVVPPCCYEQPEPAQGRAPCVE